jgi:hypothetical protein
MTPLLGSLLRDLPFYTAPYPENPVIRGVAHETADEVDSRLTSGIKNAIVEAVKDSLARFKTPPRTRTLRDFIIRRAGLRCLCTFEVFTKVNETSEVVMTVCHEIENAMWLSIKQETAHDTDE